MSFILVCSNINYLYKQKFKMKISITLIFIIILSTGWSQTFKGEVNAHKY